MKSGLEGRNNATEGAAPKPEAEGLNEVRPGRPEQYGETVDIDDEFSSQ